MEENKKMVFSLFGIIPSFIVTICLKILYNLSYMANSRYVRLGDSYHRVSEDEKDDVIREITFVWKITHKNEFYPNKGDKYTTGKCKK